MLLLGAYDDPGLPCLQYAFLLLVTYLLRACACDCACVRGAWLGHLYRDHSGVLDEKDIEDILSIMPATDKLEDHNFDLTNRETFTDQNVSSKPSSPAKVDSTNPVYESEESAKAPKDGDEKVKFDNPL